MFKTLAVTTGLLSLGMIAEAQVVVTPANMQGWTLETIDNAGNLAPGNGNTAQMVTGPATPPFGTGSAQLATAVGAGDSAAAITTSQFDGISLASLTSLSYFTYDVINNGQQFPYLALNVSEDGTPTGTQDTLFFEPPYQTVSTGNPSLPDQGATVQNQWQGWNALEGGWWDNSGLLNPGTGVGSLSTFLAAFPNATIIDNSSFTEFGGVTLQVGFGSSGETEDGNVDGFTLGTASGTTTFDFDPAPVPEPTTLALVGMGALLLYRRKK